MTLQMQQPSSEMNTCNYNNSSMDFDAPPPAKRIKCYKTAGKSAAMILHELFPNFKDKCVYETVSENDIAQFTCSFTINDVLFSAKGSSKKIAKQLTCEAALRALRPDIVLDSSFAVGQAQKLEKYRRSKETGNAVDPLTAANSFHDYFLRLCRKKELETGINFNTQFVLLEIPSLESSKDRAKRFECTLAMHDQGKLFTQICSSKVAAKNKIIRQALIQVFNISESDLRQIERKAMNLKPGKPIQVLLQALRFYDRTMDSEIDTADGKPVNPSSRFICKIMIDGEKTIIGPEAESKQKAREAACVKVLTEELKLEMPPESLTCNSEASNNSPTFMLYQLLLKQNGMKQPNIVYSDPQNVVGSVNKLALFKCILTVNGNEIFEGTGQSKKAAKNAAALDALNKIFKLDMCVEKRTVSAVEMRGEPTVEKGAESSARIDS